jgi:hypothetical protein
MPASVFPAARVWSDSHAGRNPQVIEIPGAMARKNGASKAKCRGEAPRQSKRPPRGAASETAWRTRRRLNAATLLAGPALTSIRAAPPHISRRAEPPPAITGSRLDRRIVLCRRWKIERASLQRRCVGLPPKASRKHHGSSDTQGNRKLAHLCLLVLSFLPHRR